MKHQYRLVKVHHSDGPSRQNYAGTSDGTSDTNPPRDDSTSYRTQEPSRHHLGWWIIGLVAVGLIITAAVWMTHVSMSLAQTNQAVTSNSNILHKVSNQLTGIQATLHAVSQQLSQIQNQIRSFFLFVIQHLH